MGRKQTARLPRFRVFLSHATYDKWVAKVLCEKIESYGASTFRDDRDVRSGDRIVDAIRDEIEHCDEFIVVLSPQSIQRQWVICEIGMAIALKKTIIPVMFHIASTEIPDMIRDCRGYSIEAIEDYLKLIEARMRRP